MTCMYSFGRENKVSYVVFCCWKCVLKVPKYLHIYCDCVPLCLSILIYSVGSIHTHTLTFMTKMKDNIIYEVYRVYYPKRKKTIVDGKNRLQFFFESVYKVQTIHIHRYVLGTIITIIIPSDVERNIIF